MDSARDVDDPPESPSPGPRSPMPDIRLLKGPLSRGEAVQLILRWAASIAAIFPDEFRSIQSELAEHEAQARRRRELRRAQTWLGLEEMEMNECRSRAASSRSRFEEVLGRLDDHMDTADPGARPDLAAALEEARLLAEEVEMLTDEYEESTRRVQEALEACVALGDVRDACISQATENK